MGKKIVVASMDANSDTEKWVWENGVKVRPGKQKSEYAESISKLLSVHGYDVIDDWGETYGKNKPSEDIGLVLAMHGMRGTKCWDERFDYLDSLSPNNVWCIMGSHLHTEYVIYDRLGYSGGNSYAIDPSLWGDLNKVDPEKAEKVYKYLKRKYITENKSKYAQPDKVKFESDPFVLVLGQVSGDSSIAHTNFKGDAVNHNHANYCRTMWIALNEVNKWGVKVLYKSHPREFGEWSQSIREAVKTGIWENVDLVDGVGVHQLFDQSLGVVTINSGSGFEALLHLKPVVTLGRVDYSVVTHNCSSIEDIAKAKSFVLAPADSDGRKKHQSLIKSFLAKHHEERASKTSNPDTNAYVNAVRSILGRAVARDQYGDNTL